MPASRFRAAQALPPESAKAANTIGRMRVRANRLAYRMREHLVWRLDPDLSARRRLSALAPDVVELYGVELRLGDWATPMLRGAIYDGWYEASEREIVEATVRRTDRVMELGCGIGFISTIASQRGATVRSYDANPAIVEVARATVERNGARVTVSAGVLQDGRKTGVVAFFVDREFWVSSLQEQPGADRIEVPALDFASEISRHQASYLILDIEGAEIDLLRTRIPECVRRICVECHPDGGRASAINMMLIELMSQGFVLDLTISNVPVLYLERPGGAALGLGG